MGKIFLKVFIQIFRRNADINVKRTAGKRLVGLGLAICLMLATVFCPAAAVQAAVGIQDETGAITVNQTVIGFAGYEWYVIGDNASGVATGNADYVTLLLKTGQSGSSVPFVLNNIAFRLSSDNNYNSEESEYGDSTLQKRMENTAGAIQTASSREYNLIIPRDFLAVDTDSGINSSGFDVANQRLWPLSDDEWDAVYDYPSPGAGQGVLAYSKDWWLRTPLNSTFVYKGRDTGGSIHWSDVAVPSLAARPALQLNLADGVFTSAARVADGKDAATVGSDLVGASAPTGPVKLTVRDSGLSISVHPTVIAALETPTYAPGDPVSIFYYFASGAADYISCVLVDSGGTVGYYGKLSSTIIPPGNVTVNLPAGLLSGTYTLRLFVEDVNGDNETDFASETVDIRLKVQAPSAPTLVATPNPLSFGNVTRNSSASRTVTVSGANLTGDISYSLSGDNVFSVTPATGWSSTSGGGLAVTFRPAATGSYSASLTLSGGGASSVTIPISGSGVTGSSGGSSGGSSSSGSSSSSSYTVRFQTNGGSSVSSKSVVSGGKVAEPSDPVREGYIFTGWYTDKDCTNLYNFSRTVTASFTLYAGWEPVETEETAPETITVSPYISGYPDGTFRPDAGITRSEAAMLLYNLANSGELVPGISGSSSTGFADVPVGAWHYNAVTYLAGTGAVSGYPDGSFMPEGTVTRAEFAAMLARFMGLKVGSASFIDVPPDHWASGSIAAMERAGYISGHPDGSFGPGDPITRAQAVTVLNNVLSRDTASSIFSSLAMPFGDVPSGHWAYYEIMAAAVKHSFVSGW